MPYLKLGCQPCSGEGEAEERELMPLKSGFRKDMACLANVLVAGAETALAIVVVEGVLGGDDM